MTRNQQFNKRVVWSDADSELIKTHVGTLLKSSVVRLCKTSLPVWQVSGLRQIW